MDVTHLSVHAGAEQIDGWRMWLLRESNAAGFVVDTNKALLA